MKVEGEVSARGVAEPTGDWLHVLYGNWNPSHRIWTSGFSLDRIVCVDKGVTYVLRCLAILYFNVCQVRAMIESNSSDAERITYEELEQMLDQFSLYYNNILLGGF
jgi:hypothetical protein